LGKKAGPVSQESVHL